MTRLSAAGYLAGHARQRRVGRDDYEPSGDNHEGCFRRVRDDIKRAPLRAVAIRLLARPPSGRPQIRVQVPNASRVSGSQIRNETPHWLANLVPTSCRPAATAALVVVVLSPTQVAHYWGPLQWRAQNEEGGAGPRRPAGKKCAARDISRRLLCCSCRHRQRS